MTILSFRCCHINFLILALFTFSNLSAQNTDQQTFKDATLAFQKNYVAAHEVVLGKDKKHFRFYAVNQAYSVLASFEKITDSTRIGIKTSGQKIPVKYFIRYGKLHFKVQSEEATLTIYQSSDLASKPEYKDYLFIPFTDSTTGLETYGSGRYLDLKIADLSTGYYQLDFNKAYNPYCAYTTGYNCPIPPRENALSMPILAGEMNFAKKH